MKLSNFESIGDNTGAAAMVMKVTKVEENGGAAASGIIVGDLLISLQNVDISSNEIFTKVRKEGGSRQSAKIFRNTDFLEVHLPDGKLGLDLSLADEAAEGPYQVYLEQENNSIRAIRFVTSESIGDGRIIKVIGTARGSTVRAKHIGRDLAAGLKNIVGGELKGYTELMAEGREEAIWRMKTQAKEMGANMIIASRFSSAMIDVGACEITAYGTAVIVE
jgi:uncharacterized protein YbjQ (UPF0145 family)